MKAPIFRLVLLSCVWPVLAFGAARKDWLGDPLPPGAVQRLGTQRMRYRYSIRDAAYGCDSATALAAYGRSLQVWDLKRGELLYSQQVSDKSRELRLIAASRRKPLALVADADGVVFEWNYKERRLVRQFETGRKRLNSLCYSPDERRALTLDRATSFVEEWDLATGRRTAAIDPGERKFNCAIYGPNGRTAFVGSADYLGRCPNVFHYDLKSGKVLKGLAPGRYVGVYALNLSPDGRRVLARLRYGPTTEWRVADYKQLAAGFRAPGRPGPSACYAGEERWLLTGSRDGTVRVWNRHTGKVVRKWAPHRGWVRRIRVSPDGRWALSYGDGHLLADVNIATGRPRLPWPRHTAAVRAVACSPDGATIVTGSDDRTLRVWDARTGRGVRAIAAGACVVSVAVSPDGRRALAGFKNGEVREYVLAAGALARTLRGHSGHVHAVAYLDDEHALSAADDGTLRLWDLASERAARVMRGHLGGILALAVSPDRGRVLTAGRDCTVREWELASGRMLHATLAHRGEVWAAAYSPDGRRAATGCRNGEIVVWDLSTWKPIHIIQRTARVNSLRYVRGGAALAVADARGKIVILDPSTGRPIRTLSGHGGGVNAIAVSSDGRWLVSASDDTTALVWSLNFSQMEQMR